MVLRTNYSYTIATHFPYKWQKEELQRLEAYDLPQLYLAHRCTNTVQGFNSKLSNFTDRSTLKTAVNCFLKFDPDHFAIDENNVFINFHSLVDRWQNVRNPEYMQAINKTHVSLAT